MNRIHLLAAEIFGFRYASYAEHLERGNARFEKLMPSAVRTLERAAAAGWPTQRIAQALNCGEAAAGEALCAYHRAREVVDAENPAESFRWGVRQAIEHVLKDEGLGDEASVERLVLQICYRAADMAFLLEQDGEPLSRYSRQLRREPGAEDEEGAFDE
jgi:hypothetical protein